MKYVLKGILNDGPLPEQCKKRRRELWKHATDCNSIFAFMSETRRDFFSFVCNIIIIIQIFALPYFCADVSSLPPSICRQEHSELGNDCFRLKFNAFVFHSFPFIDDTETQICTYGMGEMCKILKIDTTAYDIGYARTAGNKWICRQRGNSPWQRSQRCVFPDSVFYHIRFQLEWVRYVLVRFFSMLCHPWTYFCRLFFHFFFRLGSIIIWFL